MGSIVLLDLMGGVALLLWGLHMVRSGIMRAFGSELRRVLNIARAPPEQHRDRSADDFFCGARAG